MKSLIQKYRIPGVVILLLGIVWYALVGWNSDDDLTDDVVSWSGMIDEVFSIETIAIDDLDRSVVLTKSSQLTSASTITLSAQAPGRVDRIWLEPGEMINQWRQILSLRDTVGGYGIALERARVALEWVQLQYEQSEVQLQKSIDDAETAYKQAEQSYETLLTQRDQQLTQAALSLTTTLTNTDSTLTTLQAQLFSLKSSLQSFTITLKDHIDRIIGESIQYRSTAETYESSLIARGRWEYQQARRDFEDLDDYVVDLNAIDTSSTWQILVDVVDQLYQIVQAENDILLNLQSLYQLSLPSAWFTTQVKNQFQGEVTTLLGQSQSQLNQIVNYQDQVTKLISTSDRGQTNADITKEQAELQYQATKTQLDDALAKSSLALEQAASARNFAIKNKDIQLRLLQNSISSAQVAYNDASRNAAKLSITAPLDGQVADLLVDLGQEVSIGTPLVSFIGVAQNEVNITVNKEQRTMLAVWDPLTVVYGGDVYTGTIASIGGVADSTLSYPVTITIPDTVSVVGGTVQVKLPFVTDQPLVPLDIIRPRGRDRAMMSFWDGEQVVMQEIQTGNMWGDMIEVMLDDMPDGYDVIMTDMSRYDPAIHTITISWTDVDTWVVMGSWTGDDVGRSIGEVIGQ